MLLRFDLSLPWCSIIQPPGTPPLHHSLSNGNRTLCSARKRAVTCLPCSLGSLLPSLTNWHKTARLQSVLCPGLRSHLLYCCGRLQKTGRLCDIGMACDDLANLESSRATILSCMRITIIFRSRVLAAQVRSDPLSPVVL
ncbi:hypothetical protein VTI74DRAFT_9134 [Chaetomium olivicolor]